MSTTLLGMLTLAAGDTNLFAGKPWQSIAAVISFLILLIVLRKFAWKPILQGLQDREQKIKTDLEHAEAAAKDATATLEKHKAQLAEAHAEARKIIDDSRTAAEKITAKVKSQTEMEIAQMRDHATNDIRKAKEQAIGEIYGQTASLATQVAGCILQRELNPTDQARLVQESLDEIVRSTN